MTICIKSLKINKNEQYKKSDTMKNPHNLVTEAKLHHASISQNTTKISFMSEIKKIEMSRIKKKLCYIWASKLLSRELESHSVPSRPQTLSNRQTPVTIKAATYANKVLMRCSKSGTKYKKTQFCKK